MFRFLTKPCPQEILRGAVQAGLDQHALVHAQKDLLENTLRGSVRVFADMLGIANPGRSERPAGCGKSSPPWPR